MHLCGGGERWSGGEKEIQRNTETEERVEREGGEGQEQWSREQAGARSHTPCFCFEVRVKQFFFSIS